MAAPCRPRGRFAPAPGKVVVEAAAPAERKGRAAARTPKIDDGVAVQAERRRDERILLEDRALDDDPADVEPAAEMEAMRERRVSGRSEVNPFDVETARGAAELGAERAANL